MKGGKIYLFFWICRIKYVIFIKNRVKYMRNKKKKKKRVIGG